MKPIITGMGAVLPSGDFNLGQLAKAGAPDPAGEALSAFDLKRYAVTPKTYLDRCSALALAACSLALADAGLTGPFDADFGLAVGTRFGCIDTMSGFEGKLASGGPRAASPLLFSHSYFNSPASVVAIEWGLQGYHATFCGASAGLDALACGADCLNLAHAQRMLVGVVEARSVARQWASDDLDGLNNQLEGAMFFVIESPASAARRGASGTEYDAAFGSRRVSPAPLGSVGALEALLAHAVAGGAL